MRRPSGLGALSWTRHGLLRLKGASYLKKWLVLGALIGVVAGLGAIVFITALEFATKVLLGGLGGYVPPSPIGEGHAAGSGGFARPWAVPLVVGLGGLISGILTFRFAPEAEGHGTDAAIEAFHHNPRGVRSRVVAVKIAASAITIGSGGSGGREGPTAQISAGFGSLLGRVLDLNPADTRIAVAAGIGSGIGAIFRAPLGGAVLGAEILYRDDIEGEAIMPSIIASIVGFSIFGAFEGYTPIFGFVRGYQFDQPIHLLYFALLGLAAGAVGRLYSRSFYGVAALTRRLPGSPMVKPAVAGLLVGLLGLAVPGALGTGYGFVQQAMAEPLSGLSLWVILALPFVKILATSLSIGSGGSGGIFGPGMVIGAFVGAGVWQLLHPFAPSLPASSAPFVVVGMIACFGSISHALLGVMLMVGEMTGTLALLAPAMIALGVAALVVGDATIYTGQLKDRVESAAHRLKFGLPLLASVPANGVMSAPRLLLPGDVQAREALGQLITLGLPGAPVIDGDGVFRGSVETEQLRHQLKDADSRAISELVDPEWPALGWDATLADAIDTLVMNDVTWVSVLDTQRRVVGIVGMTEVIDGYRQTLWASLRRLGSAAKETVLVEETVTECSPCARKTLAEATWPPGSVIVSIQRGSNLLFPEGDTVLEPRDVVSILSRPGNADQLRAFLRGPIAEPEEKEEEGPHGPDMV
jgi:H+/Cl- antiporter ClcA